MSKRRNSARRATALAAAAGLVGAAQAMAQTTPEVIWDGGGTPGATGSYVTATNWNPDTVPANASNEFVQINDGGTAQIAGSDAAEAAFLMLGMRPGDTGHLEISGGTLTVGEMRVGGRETINSNLADWTLGTFDPNGGGTGTVVQTGGDVSVNYTPGTEPPVQSLYIGDAGLTSGNTANGSWDISAGTLLVGIATDDSIVIGTGPGTQGTFIQSGGTVTTTGFMNVGRAGATSTYTMSGGTLNVGQGAPVSTQNLRIGEGEYPTGILSSSTSGTFTQTNGTVNVNNEVSVGRQTGTGSYTITGSGSSLTASAMNMGASGTGTLTMGTIGGGTTPSISLRQSMSVGISASTNPGTGTFTLNSGTLAIGTSGSGTRVLAVGNEAQGKGTLIQEGGTVTSTDLIQIGRNNSDQDNLYHLKGGTVTARRIFVAGGSGAGATSGKGTLLIEGGDMFLDNPATAGVDDGENFNIASGAGGGTTAVGTMTMTGGSFTLKGAATGTTGIFTVGNGLGATGTLNQSGGTITIASGTQPVIDVGRTNSNGSYTLSGTGVLVTPTLRMADQSAGTPTRVINLNGGTSTIGTLGSGQWTGNTLNINGGNHTITTLSLGTTSTVNINMDLTVTTVAHGTMTFNVAAGRTLTTTNAQTNTVPRTITKAGDGTYTINGPQTHFAGTTLVVSAGTVNENTNVNGQNVTSAATTNFNAAVNTVGNLNVTGGTTTLAQGLTNVINSTSVAVSGGGRLDLKDNKLITGSPIGSWDGTQYTGVYGLVQDGRGDAVAPFWEGSGIVTSMSDATSSILTGLATAAGAELFEVSPGVPLGPTDTALWAGQTVNGASTLVMYTWGGDAELDGDLDGDDYFWIDSNVGLSGTSFGYHQGDFDYDGDIDGDDYFIIDSNIAFANTQPNFPTGAGAGGGAGMTAVPEPASLGVLALSAVGLLSRRRRR